MGPCLCYGKMSYSVLVHACRISQNTESDDSAWISRSNTRERLQSYGLLAGVNHEVSSRSRSQDALRPIHRNV